MATTNRFKQINPFIGRVKEQANAAHLSWMQRLLDKQSVPVDAEAKVTAGTYTLEEAEQEPTPDPSRAGGEAE